MVKLKKTGVVPKLRFPAFREAGEWPLKLAGQLFHNRIERGTEDLPIYSVTTDSGMVRRSSLDRKIDDLANSEGNKKVCKSDIAYNMMRMWQGAFGIAPEDCMVSPAYVVLAPQIGVSSDFYGQFLKTSQSLKRLTSQSHGLTEDRLRLYYKDFAQIPLMYPIPEEQQKIADCLTSLDELITAQGRKVEALKTYKRSLMQQLFPRAGETVPRLRFPEFRDAPGWKMSVLGSVCKMQAGKFVEASAISDVHETERFPCYGGNGLRGFTKTFTHSGRYPLIGRQGALCGNVNLADGEFHATEHAIVATPKDGICVDWIFCALGSLQLNQFATGQAQPGLSVDVLEKVKLNVPISAREQQRIADCIFSFDSTTLQEINALGALRLHKQALMQQIFSVVGET